MRRLITAATAAAIGLALGLAAAAAKADFSGVWTLDLTKSEGMPPAVKAQTLTIKQTGDRLEIVVKTTSEEGEQTTPDTYTLDGKEAEFMPKGPMGVEGRGRRTAAWTADGNGIDVKETATFDTPNGPVEVKATRKWALAADGKTLTIEMNVVGPMGTQDIKRVFKKN